MDLSTLNFSSLPWYAVVFIAVLSSFFTFLGARLTSKDQKESNMLTQTMQRQTQLDEFQAQMMQDYKSDYGRLRDEMSLVRQEMFEEKKKNNDLERKVDKLNDENLELRKENLHFKELVENLQKENEHLKELLANMEAQIKLMSREEGSASK